MSEPASPVPASVGIVPGPRPSLWRDAAISLGMSESTAERFDGAHPIQAGPVELSLLRLHACDPVPAAVLALVRRPVGSDADEWASALLTWNGRAMALTHSAFALTADGDAVLVTHVLSPPRHPAALASRLHSAMTICLGMLGEPEDVAVAGLSPQTESTR
jgi:hypothetical protein